MPALTESLKTEYQFLFDTCVIPSAKYPEVDACINKILEGKNAYEQVEVRTGIPWYFIGVIHCMECSCKFTTHLHNGDSLTSRTIRVPKGYPKTGKPPFTWTDSAEDALKLKALHKLADWSIPSILYQLERYNGFGYRPKGIHSPYLWSYSNHYKKGKFTADGLFDENAVSKQIGAAVLLRRISEKQIAIAGTTDIVTQIKQQGAKVLFNPAQYNADAEQLQRLLNRAGQHLKLDGFAGRNTSDAYWRISGRYLSGDPKQKA